MNARCSSLLRESNQRLFSAAFSHHEVGKFVDNYDESFEVRTICLRLCNAARIMLPQNRLTLLHFLYYLAQRSYGVSHIGNNLSPTETITTVIVSEIDTFRVNHKQLWRSPRDEQGKEQSV
ncbi:hypothetical protein BGV72_25765 [Burkholderia ubonensis]|nr:hypothetical protein BGV72_25765 [Burkholderia ubonensis]